MEGDNTVVEILEQNITVDAVPTDGSNNPVASNGVFDALATKVDKNTAITGATKTKITYDSKGLVTGGADVTAGDVIVTPPTGYTSTNVQGLSNEFAAAIPKKDTTPTAGKMHYSDALGNIVETTYSQDQVLQTSAIDYSQSAWMVGESRLLLTTKLSSTDGNFEGAAELMDLILPPAVLATIEGSDANWTNETKTVTGDNSDYALS